jgi:hypothetical protein
MNGNDNSGSVPSSDSSDQDASAHARALQRMIAELAPLRSDDRRRLIETITTFFGLNLPKNENTGHSQQTAPASSVRASSFQFSEDNEAPSPKAFMLSKSPKTDIERIACLAYYLGRYRGTPHFKTRDITPLNTDAAQRPFSNAAYAIENATKAGLLVPSVKGSKQLSALGEQFVEALPDRDAAIQILERIRHRRGSGSGKRDVAKAGKE